MSRTAQALTNTSTGIRFMPIQLATQGGAINPPGELLNEAAGVPYLEANSQEFKTGDMVYLNTGAVTQVLTGDTVAMAGFALTDATNVTLGNAQIRIMPVYTQLEYVLNVFDDTEADTDSASVALLVGNCYNLLQMTVTETDGSTTYCTAVDLDSSAQSRVLITGLYRDPTLISTSTYIRVKVKFMPFIYTSGTATNFYRNLQLDL